MSYKAFLEARASFLMRGSGMGCLGEKVMPVLVDLRPAAAMSLAWDWMAAGER